MKIGINARLLYTPELRGWNRYTVNLLAGLAELGLELILYTDRPLHEEHLARLPRTSYVVRQSPAMRYLLWEQRWLPRQCASDRVDLLHTPFNFGLPWSSSCPRVLTLHDAIDPIFYRSRSGWRQRATRGAIQDRLYHWVARTRAHRIIAVSAHAKSDLVGFLRLPADRITVVPEAADPHFHEPVPPAARAEVRKRHALSRPYIFYVGGWEGRKNVSFLLRAFATAGLEGVDLVLAGGAAAQRAELAALGQQCGVADRVRPLGWVDDAELPALYAEALAFVYPSKYEGFGLQLCEAMAVGCPILAARATSLPEVLGPGGETFSLTDPDELVQRLRQVAADPDYRGELERRARARSAAFSWPRTAQATLAIYRDVVAASHPERTLPCAPAARS